MCCAAQECGPVLGRCRQDKQSNALHRTVRAQHRYDSLSDLQSTQCKPALRCVLAEPAEHRSAQRSAHSSATMASADVVRSWAMESICQDLH